MKTPVKVILGLVAVFAIVAFMANVPTWKPNQAFASTSTSTSQTINLTVNQVITLTLSSTTFNLPALTPGSAVTATSSATVTTNAPSGFNLQVNRASATSTIASGTITFPDQTAFTGSNATSVANLANSGQNLSFREYSAGTTVGDYSSSTWGSDDAGNALYSGFPTSAVTYASTSTYVGSAQTIMMQIRANAPATQVATNYSGSILITAIALP